MLFLSSSGESEDPLFQDIEPIDPATIPPDEGDIGTGIRPPEKPGLYGSGQGENL